MIPKKKINIYPKNETNVQAIIKFYFAELEMDTEGVIKYLINEKSSLELNQIEFICRKINEGYLIVFRPNLTGQIRLKNLLDYSLNALTIDKTKWKGSIERNRITQEFLDFVKHTEIDIDYLERNN
tara:strand:- start:326 stop:703 length:378 start_codon:yes stop_codon:yes gene_type:complete